MTSSSFPCTRLVDVTSKIQDGTHFSPRLGGGRFKYITSKNIGFGKLRLDAVDTISQVEHEKIYRRADTRFGDILLTKDGANTGNAALNTFDEPISLLSSVAFIRANPHLSVESFLLQYFLSDDGQRQMADAMSGNAITRLTLSKIKNLMVPVPHLDEQSRIGATLADVDDLLTLLEATIAKKRAIKQGLIQELLTGRTRLPGFSGEWVSESLGSVSRIKTGSRNNQEKDSSGPYPFFVRSATVERIGTYSYNTEAILVPGEGGIGSIFHYINGKFEVHQRVYKISDFSPVVLGKFIYYYMRLFFGRHAMENSVKATVDSLRLPTFKSFELKFPPSREEQAAIVEALDCADAEIDALERRLKSTRDIKQGMMQELLTGRTRLVPHEEVTA